MYSLRKLIFICFNLLFLIDISTQKKIKLRPIFSLQYFQELIETNTLYQVLDVYIEKIYSNYTGNPSKYQNNCKRTCTGNDARICYYNFYMENYQAMGVACGNCAQGVIEDCYSDQCVQLDGVEKGVYSVNRRIPGPHIEVCKNDLIVIDTYNAITGTDATIHWHGILQKNTQYMDGVPFVTQCPIMTNTRFLYAFIAELPGTYFWHSHSGHNKAEGQYGALTIRGRKADDPNKKLYDVDDNVIVVSDLQHDMATMFDPGLPTRRPGVSPENFLVNGKGQFTQANGQRTLTPYEQLRFETGKRYRIRFINSASHVCPVQIQIQDHLMTVIATDASDIKPRVINSLNIYAGERYDVVVNANKTGGTFWVHFKGIGICINIRIYQLALIAYNVDPTILYVQPDQPIPAYDSYPPGIILNFPDVSIINPNYISIDELVAHDIDKTVLTGKPPDVRLAISFATRGPVTRDELLNGDYWFRFLNTGGNRTIVSTMDGILGTFPAKPYILQKYINRNSVCDDKNLPPGCDADEIFCTCNHLTKIPYGSIVEIVLIDESTAISPVNHPIHLHGFSFYVLEMKQGLNNGTRLTKKLLHYLEGNGEKVTKDAYYAPLKDTLAVPSAGFAVIRFRANNPGFWAFHCHFDVHMLTGMIMTFKVDGHIPPPPPEFPVCGDFPFKFRYNKLD